MVTTADSASLESGSKTQASFTGIWVRREVWTCVLAMLAAISMCLLGASTSAKSETLPGSAYLQAQSIPVQFAPVQSSPVQSSMVQLLRVQSKDFKDLGAGKLLVARRGLPNAEFAQTVVLLIRYDEQGSVGLIVNRRTKLPISRVLDRLEVAKDRSDPVYAGGPVESSTAFALLRSAAKVDGGERVIDGLYLLPTEMFEKAIAARPGRDAFRVYLGCAEWTKGQLQNEVERGDWFVFPADTDTVFMADPESVWRQMIQKTEGGFARVVLRRSSVGIRRIALGVPGAGLG